ncbi:MAG: tripartite tricarboxylate transporter TctB family protein [Peptococcaceae bacterium]
MKYFSGYILLILLTMAGLTGALGSVSLTFIEGALPGAGFFPVILGFLLALLCLSEFRNLRRRSTAEDKKLDPVKVKRLVLFFSALIIAVTLGSPLIGLLPALGIFLFLALIVWNKLKLKAAAVNTLIILVTIYLIFSVWLQVFMPWGLIGG